MALSLTEHKAKVQGVVSSGYFGGHCNPVACTMCNHVLWLLQPCSARRQFGDYVSCSSSRSWGEAPGMPVLGGAHVASSKEASLRPHVLWIKVKGTLSSS